MKGKRAAAYLLTRRLVTKHVTVNFLKRLPLEEQDKEEIIGQSLEIDKCYAWLPSGAGQFLNGKNSNTGSTGLILFFSFFGAAVSRKNKK